MGAGRTELAQSIFETRRITNYKENYLLTEKRKSSQPSDAIKAGIAYVTEDRKVTD